MRYVSALPTGYRVTIDGAPNAVRRVPSFARAPRKSSYGSSRCCARVESNGNTDIYPNMCPKYSGRGQRDAGRRPGIARRHGRSHRRGPGHSPSHRKPLLLPGLHRNYNRATLAFVGSSRRGQWVLVTALSE